MRRRRLARVVLFGAILAVGFAVALSARRGLRRVRTGAQAPAGGVAQVGSGESADGDPSTGDEPAIVEDGRRYVVKRWSFSLDRYEMRIEDTGMTTALDEVLARTGAELVVNGGFFDPEGRPVGLAVTEGVQLSRLGRNLSGGVLTSDGEKATLHPSEGFVMPDDARFAIQCRPRLVVEQAANVKSDDGKRAERTALCARDEGRSVEVVIVRGSDDGESPGPSLYALARHLASAGCEAALNLDGGPSTGVAWREEDAVRLLAPRKPIRHVVAFHERR